MKRLNEIIPKGFIYNYNKTKDGVYYTIMSSNGWALGTIYFYFDDATTLYLAGLSVEELHRGCGLATKILDIFEEFGTEAGYKCLRLEAEKDSWVQDWYTRRGFVEHPSEYAILNHIFPDETEIWMKKELKQNNKDGFKD